METAPVLSLRCFSYAYPEAEDFALNQISLEVFPGQCHCLTGPSGSGKTTLLMAVRGLLPHGRQSGELLINSGSRAEGSAPAGIVLQNPLIQLMGVGLGAEVAFGLENHCIPPEQMPDQVYQALAAVGLDRPLDTPVSALSMGQQYRTCLAGALVMSPAIVLLDEPAAQLDPKGLQHLSRVIEGLKSDGRAVMVCDHRPGPLAGVIDHFWRLTPDGRLQVVQKVDFVKKIFGSGSAQRPFLDRVAPLPRSESNAGGRSRSDEVKAIAIRVHGLALHGHDNGTSQPLLSFSLAQGERLAVCGPNGSGKTTLVNFLTGLSRPPAGSIEIFGHAPEPCNLRGLVGVLFQNPRKQLFGTTVFEEVAFAAKRNHRSRLSVVEQVDTLLNFLDLEPFADLSPHALSYGQQHLVGLAAVLAGEPQVLILDDPLAGLDVDRAHKVMRLLVHLSETDGMTILWTNHDPDALTGWAHHTIRLESGVVTSGLEAPDPARSPSVRKVSRGDRASCPLPTGATLAISILLSMIAFAARSMTGLVALTIINLILLFFRCPHPMAVLRRSAKLFIWQAAIIVPLYGLRFGWSSGLNAGLRVAWQLFLAFWPGIVFMASSTASRVTRALSNVLPHQTAFVVSTCLHFLPMLLGEMDSIRQAQVFRGARLLKNDLKMPHYWPDWLHCLLVPTLVRALSLAADIALAAAVRDFGIHKQRTHWPGDA